MLSDQGGISKCTYYHSRSSEVERHLSQAPTREHPPRFPEETNQPCLTRLTWFRSHFPTLALALALALCHRCPTVPPRHQADSLHVPKTVGGGAPQMASSPFNTETLWTSAPASGGTQGTQKPREPLKNSKPAAPQPGCLSAKQCGRHT